jgi:hypothetical protein
MADKNGWTVAHEAAKYKHIPANFDQWGLLDENGNSVAFVALIMGCIPNNFTQWDTENADGTTMKTFALRSGGYALNVYMAWMSKSGFDGDANIESSSML